MMIEMETDPDVLVDSDNNNTSRDSIHRMDIYKTNEGFVIELI